MRPYRVLLLLLVLAALLPSATRADTPASVDVIIPETVSITLGQHKVVLTGRSAGTTTVACQPGSWPLQSAAVIDPGGGQAAQLTSVVLLHDHEIQNGTRYRIISGPSNCGFAPDGVTLLKRYSAQLD